MSLDSVVVPPPTQRNRVRWWLPVPSTLRLIRRGCRGVLLSGTVLQVLLLTFVITQLVLAARNRFGVYRYETTTDGSVPFATYSNAFPPVHEPLLWGNVILCAVVWLVWQCEIVRSYPPKVIRYGQFVHVIAWLIPFANWIVPYLNLRDINRVLGRPVTYLVSVWWGLWLAAGFAATFLHSYTGAGRPGPGGITITDWRILDVTWILNTALGLAALVMVGAFTRAFAEQTARSQG